MNTAKKETAKCATLHPIRVFHVDNMLQSWAKTWQEYEKPTEQWELVAYPFLADGTIALLFEFRDDVIAGRYPNVYSVGFTNFYKLYVYDPCTGKTICRHRFRLQGGTCFTVYFCDQKLYGIVNVQGMDSYSVIHLWPGINDNDQFRIGKHITRAVADRNGNLFVGYECRGDHPEEAPVMCFEKHNAACKSATSPHPVVSCRDLTLDAQSRFWFHAFPDNRLLRLDDNHLTWYNVEFSGFSGFGFSENGDKLLAEFDYDDLNGCRLYVMEHDCRSLSYINPRPVQIEGIGQYISGCGSFLGSKAAFYSDGKLYVVDINELSKTAGQK